MPTNLGINVQQIYNFKMLITWFKIKILINIYVRPWQIFIPLSLIFGQFTLIYTLSY